MNQNALMAYHLRSEKDARPFEDTIGQRAMLLPVGKSGYNNSDVTTMPGLLHDLGQAVSLPKRVYDGTVAPNDMGENLNFTMNMMGGGTAFGRPANSLGSGSIRAYHGSPHDFDRFDLSKIGTGEGAQAYGHGLYFAENEGVAKAYRDALTQSKNNLNYRIDGSPVATTDLASFEAAKLAHSAGGVDAALQTLVQNKASYPKVYFDKMSAALSELKARGASVDKPEASGRMYEVNIKADPNDFLDWDKPLSQQSEKVRAAVGDMVSKDPYYTKYGPWDDPAKPVSYYLPAASGRAVTMSDHLRERGVNGIRYLDQGSRGAGEGSRNYVVFDDRLVEILRKYGLAGLAALGAAGTTSTDAPAQSRNALMP